MITNVAGLVYKLANANDGDAITISPGTYSISAPLKPSAGNLVIHGNNALVVPAANFSGDSILDMSGFRESTVRDLRVQSTRAGIATALKLGRTNDGDGSGHYFENLRLQGSYDTAVCYSVAAEGCTYNACSLVTQNDKPAYLNTNEDIADLGLLTNSNTLHWLRSCAFRNYSGAAHTGLVKFNGIGAGVSMRDCYAYTGPDSVMFTFAGDLQAVTLEDWRVEGEGSDSLFLKVPPGNYALQWRIARLNWTIASDYLIEANNHLLECELDFIYRCDATRNIHVIGAAKVWRSFIRTNKQNWITQSGGGEVRGCHLQFVGGEPQELSGTNDNETVWTA